MDERANSLKDEDAKLQGLRWRHMSHPIGQPVAESDLRPSYSTYIRRAIAMKKVLFKCLLGYHELLLQGCLDLTERKKISAKIDRYKTLIA
jgi:hypothetical protein